MILLMYKHEKCYHYDILIRTHHCKNICCKKVMQYQEEQPPEYKRNIKTFYSFIGKVLKINKIFVFKAIPRKEEEKRHVKTSNETM